MPVIACTVCHMRGEDLIVLVKEIAVLSLLSAHALISTHPCFFPIIPQVAPNKHLHLRLGLFALVDPPIVPINH